MTYSAMYSRIVTNPFDHSAPGSSKHGCVSDTIICPPGLSAPTPLASAACQSGIAMSTMLATTTPDAAAQAVGGLETGDYRATAREHPRQISVAAAGIQDAFASDVAEHAEDCWRNEE